MTKCGKSVLPECEYFTTGGCISPFNCIYQVENESITTATSIAFMPNSIWTSEIYEDVKIRDLKGEKEMKNKKNIVELGEITEVRDAENSSTVEVNIKVSLDGVFLTKKMGKAIAEAFEGNQLFWNKAANVFLRDIGKVYLGLIKGEKK